LVQFGYKGVDGVGKVVSGAVEAVDRRSAVAELAKMGHFATDLFEKSAAHQTSVPAQNILAFVKSTRFGSGRTSGKDVLAITTQLSTALRAGLPILNALEIIGAQQHKQSMKILLGDLAEAVRGGDSLSDAMGKRPEVFSRLYVSMVRVGETGGILDQTMTQLAELLGRDEKVKTNMKNASAYPIFVLSIGLISVIIVITMILPKIIETIAGGVAALPLPTRILMAISDFLISFGWLVALLIAGGLYYLRKWKRSPQGLLKWDSFKLKVPVLGSVLRTIAVGRFARTLGALTKSGITILHALGVVRDTLGNELLGREIDEVAAKVKTGEAIAEPLAKSGLFPPLLVQIVSVGEQTGKLDELLLNAADTFDEEADAATTRFMAIFPAVLILLLALIIGFIIAATLLPIIVMELGGVGL
jgi:type II secretory pathway component PulF